MKIFRKPLVNAVIISIISIFYAFIFDVTSGHIEFERILNHRVTSGSPFWNGWSIFLKQGNMKYIGYAYIAITVIIVILSIIRKRDYDEYQIGIVRKGNYCNGGNHGASISHNTYKYFERPFVCC